MAVSKAKKWEILATLEKHLKESTSVAFTSNTKLTVSEVSAMKKELRATNTTFMLAKKTLIRLAFKNIFNVEIEESMLPGQVAIVISKGDKIAGISIVNKFVNEYKKEEKIKFVAGYFDGNLLDAKAITKIASLPSREVLLAKLLGSMLSPVSALARFFDGAKNELEKQGKKTVSELTLPKTEAPAAEAPVESTPAPEAPATAEASPETPETPSENA